MAGERGAGDADCLGDLSGWQLPPCTCKEEEHTQPGQMGECLERLGVAVTRLQGLVGFERYLHISQYIEI